MTVKEIRANLLLLLTAAIWGLAFVAQRMGAEHVGAFTFNAIRFAIGSISLLPLIFFLNRKKNVQEVKEEKSNKEVFKYGALAGCALFGAAALQQMGVAYTTAGKAGFITGLYMVIVPVLGIFLKQKAGKNTWIGIVIAIIGLYLLSIKEGFSISKGDFLVLLSSFLWGIHILMIDNFTKKVDSLKLSSIQFATCAALSLVAAVLTESITLQGINSAIIPLLYGGLLSVGVAYTLQVVAQKDAKPSHAAILLSTESVFAVIGGTIVLGEMLGGREILGCILIFIAIIVAQLKPKSGVKLKESVNK